jgi:hypothetical protein
VTVRRRLGVGYALWVVLFTVKSVAAIVFPLLGIILFKFVFFFSFSTFWTLHPLV